MYGIYECWNYRKDTSSDLIYVVENLNAAKKIAKLLAKLEYGDDVNEFNGVQYYYLDNIIKQYSSGDGYFRNVYAVCEYELPQITDSTKLIEDLKKKLRHHKC